MLQQLKDKFLGKVPKDCRRSSRWPSVRAAHLEKNPTCALCGGIEALEVHHIVPFHIDPANELNPANLITLCESKRRGVNCHLGIGHLGNYKRSNPTVREDVDYLRKRFAA